MPTKKHQPLTFLLLLVIERVTATSRIKSSSFATHFTPSLPYQPLIPPLKTEGKHKSAENERIITMALPHFKNLIRKTSSQRSSVSMIRRFMVTTNNNNEKIENVKPMLGAIVGDVAGSTYEVTNCKSMQDIKIFAQGSKITDDTILTLATAKRFLKNGSNDIIDENKSDISYQEVYQKFGQLYPNAGYGSKFQTWISSENPQPYGSWGNGSAMRVSPIGWVAPTLKWAMEEAKESAIVTHDHPDAIIGAQAIAACIYLAKTGKHDKDYIRTFVTDTFGYDLNRNVEEIRPMYEWDLSCKGSVPESIVAFLDSEDFEDAIKKAISLGGDSDTIAAMTGSIAHAYYGTIPEWMVEYCRGALDDRLCIILDEFSSCYVRSGR